MQWLAALSVRRPVLATVLILMLVVIGIYGYVQLGVDRMPKVDFPTVVITTLNPGAAAEEIDREITDKIEEAVNTISGLDELRSTSSEGVSVVVASFLLEKNGDVAAQEVRDQVNRVMPLLPETIRQPTIQKIDPDASPVLTLVVSSKRPIRDTTEFADKVLRRALENVNGVGQVMVIGGRQRQINVWLDGGRLRAYNLTVNDVARALQSQNIEVPGGRIENGPQWVTLRTRGRVQSVAEFNQIVVRQREGHPITIAEVATVEDGMADPSSIANVNGVPSVTLQMRRQSGTNTVEVVDAVLRRLEQLKPTLPPGYDVRVVRDSSEYIKASIATVKEHLVLGSIFAALVVAFFLWNYRSTVIAAIAIPTSIISTFGLIWYEGFTLNSMTMLALTLSVGIVIDDAIVVIENIYRFVEEKGRSPMKAAVEATKEIGLAVLATTLSLVAIFLPMAFMGGIVGRFMQSFGMTMAFAVMVSLLVSFTLTPMLGSRWLRAAGESARSGHGSKDSWFFHGLDHGYTRVLDWALAHRGRVAAIAGLVLLSTVPLGIVVHKNFFPLDDQSEFQVGIRAPEGASLQSTELVTNRVASMIRQRVPEAMYTLVSVASDTAQTPNLASIYVKLAPLEERRRDQFEIMNEVRSKILPTFDAEHLRTSVRPVSGMGGPGTDIQFVINGPDLNQMATYARQIAGQAARIPGAVDVDTSLNLGKPEVSVALNRAKAADLGVQVSDVAGALRWLVGGDQVTTYNEGGEQYEVHLRARAEDRASEVGLAALTVPSSRLGALPLENIATLQRSEAPTQIDRLARQRQVSVYAGLLPGVSQTPVMTAIQRAAADLGMPVTYQTRFTGQSREMGRAAQNFVLAFGLSLVFMYLILAAQFESWLHPVTILLSLPLTLPFALLSILLTNQSMNIFSALGLFVLFGVVKKNAILQIDHANMLRASGMERNEAVVRACRNRLRPILMTTSAFVAGMIPLVASSGPGSGTNRAIGVVIMGGQSLALLLTLVATPVAYTLFDDASRLRLWRRAKVSKTAPVAAEEAPPVLVGE
jgi:hydrophobic/amphiphilic exporter-1 (mainly G- bacteria), HAE1 family